MYLTLLLLFCFFCFAGNAQDPLSTQLINMDSVISDIRVKKSASDYYPLVPNVILLAFDSSLRPLLAAIDKEIPGVAAIPDDWQLSTVPDTYVSHLPTKTEIITDIFLSQAGRFELVRLLNRSNNNSISQMDSRIYFKHQKVYFAICQGNGCNHYFGILNNGSLTVYELVTTKGNCFGWPVIRQE